MSTKQVIVIRTKYPDGKGGTRGLRTGKLIAQGSHASMAFLTRTMNLKNNIFSVMFSKRHVKNIWEWINNSFAKVCVSVDSEEELMDIYQKAKEAGMLVELIVDSGKTEFDGVPTRTCLAIGPDKNEQIDKITGSLKLL